MQTRSPDKTSGLKMEIWDSFYRISFYFFSTYYVPGIGPGTRNSVVHETKPLSSWSLLYLWGRGGGKGDNR